jgi:hypothetical protein
MAYLLHNVDKLSACNSSVTNKLETLQVLDCSLKLAIERSGPDVSLHTRLLAYRPPELCVDGELGPWAFACRE